MRRKAGKILGVLMVFCMMFALLAPATVQAAGKTVTVGTQKELDAALTDPAVTKIAIKAQKNKTLTIPEGDYSHVALVVQAPKVTLHNYGTFRVVKIRDARKFMEYASGNTIKVTDTKLTLGVETGAQVEALYLSQPKAESRVVVRGEVTKLTASEPVTLDLTVHGTLTTLNLQQTSTVTVSGDTTENITVNTGVQSDAMELTASVSVKVQPKAEMTVTLESGAEASTVIAKTEAAETAVTVTNNTTVEVTITATDGTETTVAAETTVDTGAEDADADDTDTESAEDAESGSDSSTSNTGSSTGNSTIYDNIIFYPPYIDGSTDDEESEPEETFTLTMYYPGETAPRETLTLTKGSLLSGYLDAQATVEAAMGVEYKTFSWKLADGTVVDLTTDTIEADTACYAYGEPYDTCQVTVKLVSGGSITYNDDGTLTVTDSTVYFWRYINGNRIVPVTCAAVTTTCTQTEVIETVVMKDQLADGTYYGVAVVPNPYWGGIDPNLKEYRFAGYIEPSAIPADGTVTEFFNFSIEDHNRTTEDRTIVAVFVEYQE